VGFEVLSLWLLIYTPVSGFCCKNSSCCLVGMLLESVSQIQVTKRLRAELTHIALLTRHAKTARVGAAAPALESNAPQAAFSFHGREEAEPSSHVKV